MKAELETLDDEIKGHALEVLAYFRELIAKDQPHVSVKFRILNERKAGFFIYENQKLTSFLTIGQNEVVASLRGEMVNKPRIIDTRSFLKTLFQNFFGRASYVR